MLTTMEDLDKVISNLNKNDNPLDLALGANSYYTLSEIVKSGLDLNKESIANQVIYGMFNRKFRDDKESYTDFKLSFRGGNIDTIDFFIGYFGVNNFEALETQNEAFGSQKRTLVESTLSCHYELFDYASSSFKRSGARRIENSFHIHPVRISRYHKLLFEKVLKIPFEPVYSDADQVHDGPEENLSKYEKELKSFILGVAKSCGYDDVLKELSKNVLVTADLLQQMHLGEDINFELKKRRDVIDLNPEVKKIAMISAEIKDPNWILLPAAAINLTRLTGEPYSKYLERMHEHTLDALSSDDVLIKEHYDLLQVTKLGDNLDNLITLFGDSYDFWNKRAHKSFQIAETLMDEQDGLLRILEDKKMRNERIELLLSLNVEFAIRIFEPYKDPEKQIKALINLSKDFGYPTLDNYEDIHRDQNTLKNTLLSLEASKENYRKAAKQMKEYQKLIKSVRDRMIKRNIPYFDYIKRVRDCLK